MSQPNEILRGEALNSLMDGRAPLVDMAIMLMMLDVHPPIYYWLAELWTRVFGSDPLAIRSLSLLATAGAVILVAAVPIRLHGLSRLTCAGVLLFAPPIIFAASNARDYGISLLLTAAVIFFAHLTLSRRASGQDDEAGRAYLLACLIAGIAFLTHYFTAFICAPALLSILPDAWRAKRRSTIIGLASGSVLLVMALPFLKYQFGARPAQYDGYTETTAELLSIIRNMATQLTIASGQAVMAQVAIYAVFVVVAISIATLVAQAIQDRHARMHVVVLGSFAMLVLALFAATDKTLTEASPRYMLFALPSLALAISYLVERLIRLNGGRIAAASFLAAWFVVITAIPYGAGYGKMPLPFRSHAGLEVERVALEEAEANDGLIIIPRGTWDSVVIYPVIPNDVDVFQGLNMEAIDDAFEEARHRTHVVVLSPPRWDPAGIKFIEGKTKELEECGFVRDQDILWVRGESSTCIE